MHDVKINIRVPYELAVKERRAQCGEAQHPAKGVLAILSGKALAYLARNPGSTYELTTADVTDESVAAAIERAVERAVEAEEKDHEAYVAKKVAELDAYAADKAYASDARFTAVKDERVVAALARTRDARTSAWLEEIKSDPLAAFEPRTLVHALPTAVVADARERIVKIAMDLPEFGFRIDPTDIRPTRTTAERHNGALCMSSYHGGLVDLTDTSVHAKRLALYDVAKARRDEEKAAEKKRAVELVRQFGGESLAERFVAGVAPESELDALLEDACLAPLEAHLGDAIQRVDNDPLVDALVSASGVKTWSANGWKTYKEIERLCDATKNETCHIELDATSRLDGNDEDAPAADAGDYVQIRAAIEGVALSRYWYRIV